MREVGAVPASSVRNGLDGLRRRRADETTEIRSGHVLLGSRLDQQHALARLLRFGGRHFVRRNQSDCGGARARRSRAPARAPRPVPAR